EPRRLPEKPVDQARRGLTHESALVIAGLVPAIPLKGVQLRLWTRAGREALVRLSRGKRSPGHGKDDHCGARQCRCANTKELDMNMPLVKSENIRVASIATARVLPMGRPRRPPLAERLSAIGSSIAARIIPPAVVLAVGLVIWELLCRKSGATLPPPSVVLRDSWELIVDPFFDRGGIDRGLFWHLSASLQRVAVGYALASMTGIALGTLVGQSVWA